MRIALARLLAWLHRPDAADLAGPIPLAAASVPSQEWLAAHFVCLPRVPAAARRARDV